MLTLDDINKLPNDPSEDHLRALGLLPQPAAPPSIIPAAGAIPKPSPVTSPAPMTADWRTKLAATTPHVSEPLPPLSPVSPAPNVFGEAESAPRVAPTEGPESPLAGHDFPKLAPLDFKGRQALPTTSEGVAPGSKESFEAQLARMQDQKANPWGSPENHPGLLGKIGHYAAKIGNIAGDIVAPATMANIPGTDLNKQLEERGLEKKIAETGKEEEAVKTGESERELRSAQTEEAEAKADKLGKEGQPDIIQDPAGNAVGWHDKDGEMHSFDDPETPPALKAIQEKWRGKSQAKPQKENVEQGLAGAIQDAIESDRDPESDKAVQFWEKEKEKLSNQKESKASEEDKAISDYLSGHNIPDTPKNRDRARSVLKTRDRTSADEETRELKKELLRGQVAKSQEPTADEQRRADLGNNMMENLSELEAIVDKRPDLFGPVAGRITGMKRAFGTDDKQIAQLGAIKEYLGMASVGAHAMRNAQHVETAADAVMNSLHNSPGATKAAIQQARKSVQTFLDDANRRRNVIEKEKEQAGGGGGGGAAAGETQVHAGFEYKKGADGQWHKGKAVQP